MTNLNETCRKSFKSKPTLRILCALADKGLITFDPFTQTATLTEAGHKHLQ